MSTTIYIPLPEWALMLFPSHCRAGMVFAINPTTDMTFEAFQVRQTLPAPGFSRYQPSTSIGQRSQQHHLYVLVRPFVQVFDLQAFVHWVWPDSFCNQQFYGRCRSRLEPVQGRWNYHFGGRSRRIRFVNGLLSTRTSFLFELLS